MGSKGPKGAAREGPVRPVPAREVSVASYGAWARPLRWPAMAISSLNEGLIYDLLCFRFMFLLPAKLLAIKPRCGL